MRLVRVLLSAVLALAVSSRGGTAEIPFKIVVNPTNPISSLSRTALSDIFMRKVTEWQGGLSVMPVDQLETSALHAAFTEQVHGKTVLVVRKYWEKELASGTLMPPLHKSEADTLTFVKVHAGAIGYVGRDVDVGKLKVITIH
jgi:ABC-type phosphate transport system substrate-binding protein